LTLATKIYTLERPPRVAAGGSPPSLLLLHGFGSNEEDLMGLAPYLDPRLHIVSARGLYDIGFGYAWYYLYGVPGNLQSDDATKAQSLETLTKFVRDLPGRLGSEPSRTYLLGFSQGAIMSLALALTAPELVAGIIPVSGYLDETILPKVQPEHLSSLNVLLIHGTEDDVIPVEGSRRAHEYLQTTPAHVTYQEYPIGHGIHPQAVGLIQQWFNERLEGLTG
jgi:phospholipase/carboxylesterase